ncbi:MAG TPA: hypothetical protein VKF15_04965 [Nitrososphaerales archaeon]|nr:hypothetical protein [Nitrososphaerales archaeon]
MGKPWEIRGLFGNEYAMGQAAEELKKQKGFEAVVLDRRNLSVRMAERDKENEAIVRRTIELHHGYVESEAPLGNYEEKREAAKAKKLKAAEKKKRR